MKWKKDFNAVNCRLLCFLLVLVFALSGCAGHPVKIMPQGYVRPDLLAAAWKRLVEVESLDVRGILKLETGDGQKSSQRVRFTAKSPDLLKIQWLTPWYTVAWQLLIVGREFWLSDSKGQVTYHGDLGMLAAPDTCAQGNKWWTSIALMASWRRLFSKPPSALMHGENRDEPGLAQLPVDHTHYLITEDGMKPAGKIIRFTDGTEWQVRYEDFFTTKTGKLFPKRLEISCPAAKLELQFSQPRLNHELEKTLFIYQQKKFRMKEVDCHNFFIP